MRLFGFFDQRFRGFRVVELGGVVVLLTLVLVVYLAKSGAGDKSADIDHLSQEIVDERTEIRLLNAEVAHQEQPERIEALSNRYLGLAPVPAAREITIDRLPQLIATSAPVTAAAAAAAPSPATAEER
jgi:hypothetical protein